MRYSNAHVRDTGNRSISSCNIAACHENGESDSSSCWTHTDGTMARHGVEQALNVLRTVASRRVMLASSEEELSRIRVFQRSWTYLELCKSLWKRGRMIHRITRNRMRIEEGLVS